MSLQAPKDGFDGLSLTLRNQLTQLIDSILSSTNVQQLSSYLGRGSSCNAFLIQDESNQYVVRLGIRDMLHPDTIERRKLSMQEGRDINNLEQFVACNKSVGIIISTLVEGKHIHSLNTQEINAISDDKFLEGFETIEKAIDRGIIFDPKPSNLFYDPIKGFGFVDYSYNSTKNYDRNEHVAQTIASLAVALTNAQFYGRYPIDKQTIHPTIDAMHAGIEKSQHLVELTSLHYGEKHAIAELVKKDINKQIKAMTQTINDLKVECGLISAQPAPPDVWWNTRGIE